MNATDRMTATPPRSDRVRSEALGPVTFDRRRPGDTMASRMKGWSDFVQGWRGFRASLAFASRFGRIFALRDRGEVDEALTQALALAADVKASPEGSNAVNRMMAAGIVDELARRVDRHDVAYDSLKHALDIIEEEKAKLVPNLHPKPGDLASLLGKYERRFRESVNLIVSHRNG